MERKLFIISAIIIFFGACYFLISGSKLLTKPFIEAIEMPLGTIITWIGLISFQIIVSSIIKKKSAIKGSKYYRLILKSCILLAVFWGVIGYILANNWAYNFSNITLFRGGEKAALIFFNFFYFLLIFPVVVLLIYGVQSLFLLFKKKQP